MRVNASISQLSATYGQSFMNTIEDTTVRVGVWGCYTDKTALFKKDYQWFIVQFNRPEDYKQFIEEYKVEFIGWLSNFNQPKGEPINDTRTD